MSDAQGNMILLITIQKGAHQSCLCANTWNAYVHLMSTTPTKQFGSNLIVVMLWTTFVSGNEVKEYNPEAIHIALAGGTSISANCLRIHISCRSTPVTRLSSYGFDSRQLQNKPKKTNRNDTIDLFLKGVSTIHATLGLSRRLGGTLQKNLSEATAPFLKQQPFVADKCWGNPPHNLFDSKAKAICPK